MLQVDGLVYLGAEKARELKFHEQFGFEQVGIPTAPSVGRQGDSVCSPEL